MDVVRLSAEEYHLFATRFAEHGNSHRRMAAALAEAGASDALDRIRAMRRIEARFGVDLGSLCHRFLHRDDEATHPLERAVMNYVARARSDGHGRDELWVQVDRVRALRELIGEGELVGESDPAAG